MFGLAAHGRYVHSCASSNLPAKYRVEVTKVAEADLEEIWILIAADSVQNATYFISQLDQKIGTLERMPNRCSLIQENAHLGAAYRHLIIGDYRVIFRVEASNVYILRILHGNRLLDASLFGSF
jgi:toxin ParE1/3/4